MRIASTTMALLMVVFGASAQQLPWSPTLRYPFTAPTTFIGFDVSLGYASHTARLPYLDEVYGIPCCTYESGSGAPIGLSGVIESWIVPTIAVSGSIGLVSEALTFATLPVTVPRANKPDLQTQYVLENQQTWAQIAIGTKMRVPASPLTVGVRLAGNVLMGSTMSHKEVVLGPDDYMFLTDPPSKEYVLPDVTFTDVSGFVVRPSIAVTYDVPLAYGYYIAPSLRLETTMSSLSRQHAWNSTTISVGVTLFKGL